jgi:D-beta-D-heptose 7-phosphate kinase/D-beta-D-heptose 1-phosphate adenosyltransferase
MNSFFSRFSNNLYSRSLTINVIGDVLIDEYYQVEVDRISPEFPIPIHCSSTEEPYKVLCGGAANVAMQFRNFDVKTNLISLISPKMQDICEANGINTEYSIVSKNVKNPIKKRFYKDFHPLIRWDIEQPNFGLSDIQKHLNNITIPDSDINIFSDYDKGLFSTNWHKKYLKQSKSLVDPKKNLNIWEGCYLFKPNSVEAKRFVNKEKVEDQLKWLQALLGCDSVVITNAGEGVSAIDNDKKIHYVIPNNKPVKPESLTGAGDAYIAFLAMALGIGVDLKEAISIAFEAGTKYVSNRYNKPLNPSDFFVKDKLITNPAVLRNRDFNLVWTNGCFDFGLTSGHIECLKFAKTQGDKVVVGLNSDASIARLKGNGRPILPLKDRINILSSLESVDFIVCFEEDTPLQTIEKIIPNTIVKGGDYKKENVAGNKISNVVIFDYIEGISTTEKIRRTNEVSGNISN